MHYELSWNKDSGSAVAGAKYGRRFCHSIDTGAAGGVSG